jgi:hypothetical protein
MLSQANRTYHVQFPVHPHSPSQSAERRVLQEVLSHQSLAVRVGNAHQQALPGPRQSCSVRKIPFLLDSSRQG